MVEVTRYVTSEFRLFDGERRYMKNDIIEVVTTNKPNITYLGRIELITDKEVYLDMSSRFKVRVEIIPIKNIDTIKIFGYYKEK